MKNKKTALPSSSLKTPALLRTVAFGLLVLGAGPAIAGDDAVIATVNGTTLHERDINEFMAERGLKSGQAPRERVIEELVARELIYRDALARDLEKRPEFQAKLKKLKMGLLISAAVQDALERNPVSEKELKTAYQELVDQLPKEEYKARHILVKSEDEAKDLIKQLDKGADFAKLAKDHSIDPGKGNGGDLGWFAPSQMVAPFSAAVESLKKGKYTESPVKTRFGWHVILLEDKRKVPLPAFKDVEDKLRAAVGQRHTADYLRSLREKASVTIPKPAPR